MYYTCFLIQFVIKKLFGDYIWDLKANKHVQRWAYWKVCGLIIHLRETVHFCGVINRESVTFVGRTNWRLDNYSPPSSQRDNIAYHNSITRKKKKKKKKIYIYIYVYMYICIYVYIYIYVYITNCRQYCFGLLGLISAVLMLGWR